MRDAMAKLGSDANKINPLVHTYFLVVIGKVPSVFNGPPLVFTAKSFQVAQKLDPVFLTTSLIDPLDILFLNSIFLRYIFSFGVQVPVDLVIDHSVQVDVARSPNALQANMELEFSRNKERFGFLKWGSTAFHNMLVVPPGSGIVHQVNALESGTLDRRKILCIANMSSI